jgi:hypothetical protein
MTRWIERRDETTDGVTDGAAMDCGDDVEQRRLWCSDGTSRGETQWRECGAATARRRRCGRTVAAWRRGGDAEENNNVVVGSWEDGGGAEENNDA